MTSTTGSGNYRRRATPLVILSLLKREDMYGYQLVQEMERQSGGMLTTPCEGPCGSDAHQPPVKEHADANSYPVGFCGFASAFCCCDPLPQTANGRPCTRGWPRVRC